MHHKKNQCFKGDKIVDSDIATEWTENDIQPVFEWESTITVLVDKNSSELDCFSVFFDRNQLCNVKT